jgi:dienelactone hydrolase
MKLLLVVLILLIGGTPVYAELRTQLIEYHDGEVLLEGYLAYDDSFKTKRPGIMVVHEWWGLNQYIKKRTEELARLGYVAFAADMYGKGINTDNPKKAGELAGAYTKDRKLMRSRALAGLRTLSGNSHTDPDHIVAIGYCFGGTTVLELARSGANISGVASFHGGLDTPDPDAAKNIKGSVLVLQGANDPFNPPEKVDAFQDEMRKANVDWQMNIYGGAEHSFTNPDADSFGIKGVAYNAKADKRSWEALMAFFKELFKENR